MKCIWALHHSEYSQENKNLPSYFNQSNKIEGTLYRDARIEKPERMVGTRNLQQQAGGSKKESGVTSAPLVGARPCWN